MTRRQWIALVGPPASGKSTFARCVLQARPELQHASDLGALQELCAFYAGREVEAVYWPELSRADPRHDERMRLLSDGGFDIIDPGVWDEALHRTIRRYREAPAVALEFARGVDLSYLSMHRVPAADAYLPSFRLLLKDLENTETALIVVHVSAPLAVRLGRNDARRSAGEHFVADSVMRSVYSEDVLRNVSEIAIDHETSLSCYQVDGTQATERSASDFLVWWGARCVAGTL